MVSEKIYVVIDDEELIRELLSAILEQAGVSSKNILSCFTKDGLERCLSVCAEKVVQEKGKIVAFVDWNMPGLDTPRVIEAISNLNTGSVTTVGMSADPTLEEKFLKLGAAGFLQKPLSIEQVLSF